MDLVYKNANTGEVILSLKAEAVDLYPSQSEQVRLDGDLFDVFTVRHVYEVGLPNRVEVFISPRL